LPIKLPEGAEFLPGGDSPLARVPSFVDTTCPVCGKPARRETDTMDTFVDSSWYYLRYTSPDDVEQAFDPELVKFWMPVDQYMGGAEHATLHLLYARFFTRALRDLGLVDFSEPFKGLRNQGMIVLDEGKMSKSKGNVIPPDALVASHGADALRLYEMFIAPWAEGGVWQERGIDGTRRFLARVHYLATRTYPTSPVEAGAAEAERELLRLAHRTIKRSTDYLENFKFNTYVAGLMELANALQAASRTDVQKTHGYKFAIDSLLLLLAPAAPHLAEEMWMTTGHGYSIHQQPWPSYDAGLEAAEEFELVVQVNGKVRERLQLPVGLEEDRVRELVFARPRVAELLAGKSPRNVIYVPGKLISIVV
jgi:leucyl-tRNA synthetase